MKKYNGNRNTNTNDVFNMKQNKLNVHILKNSFVSISLTKLAFKKYVLKNKKIKWAIVSLPNSEYLL